MRSRGRFFSASSKATVLPSSSCEGTEEQHSSVQGTAESWDSAEALSCDVGDGPDDYVLVEKDDAVNAVAYYLACYITQAPEARALQAMTPKQLQDALRGATVTSSRRGGRVRRALRYGRYLQPLSALLVWSTLRAYNMGYVSPWMTRAFISACWAASQYAIRALMP